jgi:hypothetical protein
MEVWVKLALDLWRNEVGGKEKVERGVWCE